MSGMLVDEHQRTAYYRPPVLARRRDAAVIAALTDVVERFPRWAFWKLFDCMRTEGRIWKPQARAEVRARRPLAAPAELEPG